MKILLLTDKEAFALWLALDELDSLQAGLSITQRLLKLGLAHRLKKEITEWYARS